MVAVVSKSLPVWKATFFHTVCTPWKRVSLLLSLKRVIFVEKKEWKGWLDLKIGPPLQWNLRNIWEFFISKLGLKILKSIRSRVGGCLWGLSGPGPLCVRTYTLCTTLHYVYNIALCVDLNTLRKILHKEWYYTPCVKEHTFCKT